jgi:hypothetical protein
VEPAESELNGTSIPINDDSTITRYPLYYLNIY